MTIFPGDIVMVSETAWIDFPGKEFSSRHDHFADIRRFYVVQDVPSNSGNFHGKRLGRDRVNLHEWQVLRLYRRRAGRYVLIDERSTVREMSRLFSGLRFPASVPSMYSGDPDATDYWESKCLDMVYPVD